MRILSFNVNGIRARIKNGWPDEAKLKELDLDVICLQEVRAQPDQIPVRFLQDYIAFPSIHKKAGYAGAWIYVRPNATKLDPLFHTNYFPADDAQETGRVSVVDFQFFKVVTSYSPNSGSRLEKITTRKDYEQKLFNYVADCADYKPVILCGDLNVAPEDIDTNIKCQAGTSPAERTAFAKYAEIGYIDVWRKMHPDKQQFSFFSNMYDARSVNKGMRLDHFLIPESKFAQVRSCEFLSDFHGGSDHTPLLLDIDI